MGWKEFDEWMDKPAVWWYYEDNSDSKEVIELRKQNNQLKELLLHIKQKHDEHQIEQRPRWKQIE